MRAGIGLAVVVAALTLGLSSCVYVPVEPVPPYRYVAPVPVAPYPPAVYPRCGRGWHWVRGHYTRFGQWVPGHCARNWVSPSRRTEREEAPPEQPTSPPRGAPAPSSSAAPPAASPAQPTPQQTSP
jgi:hypothetical protein